MGAKGNTFQIRTRLKPHLEGYAVMSAYVPSGQKVPSTQVDDWLQP